MTTYVCKCACVTTYVRCMCDYVCVQVCMCDYVRMYVCFTDCGIAVHTQCVKYAEADCLPSKELVSRGKNCLRCDWY